MLRRRLGQDFEEGPSSCMSSPQASQAMGSIFELLRAPGPALLAVKFRGARPLPIISSVQRAARRVLQASTATCPCPSRRLQPRP